MQRDSRLKTFRQMVRDLPSDGTCALCLKQKELRSSHILSASFSKTLNRDKFGKRIVEGNTPVQTSLNFPLLCGCCEENVSAFETSFINGVHTPLSQEADSKHIRDLDLLFCDSIVWRVIQAVITRYAFGFRHDMNVKQLRSMLRLSKALRVSLAQLRPDQGCVRFVCPDFRLPNIGKRAESFFRMSVAADFFFNGEVLFFFVVLPGGILLVMIFDATGGVHHLWRNAQVLKESIQIKPRSYAINDGYFAIYLQVLVNAHSRGEQTEENMRRLATQMDVKKMLRSKTFSAIVRDAIVPSPKLAKELIVARGDLELDDFSAQVLE